MSKKTEKQKMEEFRQNSNNKYKNKYKDKILELEETNRILMKAYIENQELNSEIDKLKKRNENQERFISKYLNEIGVTSINEQAKKKIAAGITTELTGLGSSMEKMIEHMTKYMFG